MNDNEPQFIASLGARRIERRSSVAERAYFPAHQGRQPTLTDTPARRALRESPKAGATLALGTKSERVA
jgi:hypothetical protein